MTGQRIRVSIDPVLCARSGVCSSIAPEVFIAQHDQSTAVRSPTVSGEDAVAVQEAADECPAGAIVLAAFDE